MSFQAYLDSIKKQTGKDPDDFRALASEKGLTGANLKAAPVVAWLKEDFGLGHGHAMAIYAVLKNDASPRGSQTDQLDALFAGGKAKWRPAFETLLQTARSFGDDVAPDPAGSYASLLRNGKKFAIVQPAVGHLDIGIKRKNAVPTDRFALAGDWNRMVTHRVRISETGDLDAEILDWLRAAYESAA